MPIQPWLELSVSHAFFTNGLLAGARIEPDAATAAKLRGLRVVAKPKPGGLVLYGDLDEAGKPVVPVPAGSRLGFVLRSLPPEMVVATDLSAFEREPGSVFTDERAAAGDPRPLRLTARETRGQEILIAPRAGRSTLVLSGRPRAGARTTEFRFEGSRAGVSIFRYEEAGRRVVIDGAREGETLELSYPAPPPRTPDALAPIEVGIGPDAIAEAAAGRPRRWVVALEPAAARWCYHVQTNLPDPVTAWKIVQGAGVNGGRSVRFDAGGRSELVEPVADDPTGAALKRRAPPLRVLRFLSNAPVACSETPVRGLELHAGTTRVFAALPNPAPGSLGRVGGQIVFSEVVRLVA